MLKDKDDSLLEETGMTEEDVCRHYEEIQYEKDLMSLKESKAV